ncbi:Ff.00g076850.m01.CDS01 [Fusarium sp. VM40]|nr:Ff.00g076850.m01.CDS01 [Fusarium sp. VM40]
MRFSAFLIVASAAIVAAAPSVVHPFSQVRAALNETAPSPDREDGKGDLLAPGREEDGKDGREDGAEDREDRKDDREEGQDDKKDDGRDEDREDRKEDDNKRGGLAFGQVDLNYLLQVNELNLVKLKQLSGENNFDITVFADLFASKDFSLKQLLELQQLSTVLKIAETGIFDEFELSRLELGGLNLGLIDGIASIDLTKFIDAALKPKITIIAKKVTNVIVI